MKIAVAGTGYVGLVTGVSLSEVGHSVTCIDIDTEKIAQLKNGISPIYEPGIEEMMGKNLVEGRLKFTTSEQDAYDDADIIFIAVGTPENKDGSANLNYVYNVASAIAKWIKKDSIVSIKSTVPVGTNEEVLKVIQSNLKHPVTIQIVSNPEFLREGSAIKDTFYGDRIIVGANDHLAGEKFASIYEPFHIPIIFTDIRSAEMIKYAANAFLATKISFINEISNICEKLGANIEDVAVGIGSDKRIGQQFLNAGIGYGGSCFPKDTKALVQIAGNVEHRFELLESVIKVNIQQQLLLVKKLKNIYHHLQNKRIAVLGLAFKPNTDDIREAASISVISELLKEKCSIIAYDPIATQNVKEIFGDQLEYTTSIEDALTQADAALILTEWDKIKETTFQTYSHYMREAIIIDGRNCYELEAAKNHNVVYISVGREEVKTL